VIDLLSGSVTRKYTLTLSAITEDEWRFGGYVTDKSWNLLRETRGGKLFQKWTPKRPNYEFPMKVGKTWTATGARDSDDGHAEHTMTFKVIRREPVIVPAGVFDALRVEGSSGEGVGTHRYRYSPVAGRIVACEYEETNWKGVLHRKDRDELVSYKRGGGK
jgi:hypothetical protein